MIGPWSFMTQICIVLAVWMNISMIFTQPIQENLFYLLIRWKCSKLSQISRLSLSFLSLALFSSSLWSSVVWNVSSKQCKRNKQERRLTINDRKVKDSSKWWRKWRMNKFAVFVWTIIVTVICPAFTDSMGSASKNGWRRAGNARFADRRGI